jgi:ABC-type nitrate/sulfonate/bicarbonate transport system substrate-binding protein
MTETSMVRRASLALLVLAGVLAGACAAPTAAPGAGQSAPPPTSTANASPTSPALAPAASATSAAAAPQAPAERVAVKYAYLPVLAYAPSFIAHERGYFAEQGLEVEHVKFDSSALAVAPLTAGQLDFISAVPSPSLFNALARDLPMKAIATSALAGAVLLLRKDLADSGEVRTIQDLKGRRVSFGVEGSPPDYGMRVAFQMSGVSLQDVEVLRLPNPDLAAGLANGGVDAGVGAEPFPVQIESRGIGVRLANI